MRWYRSKDDDKERDEMSRWGIENDDGWFIVYKDGVEVASSENGDRMADVLNDAFHDANARIAELEAHIAALEEVAEIEEWDDFPNFPEPPEVKE